MRRPHVAIIGAGISGLACGRAVAGAGAGVVVFEKSRSLGGRLATRRWEGHVVDHGAPWFSAVPAGLQDLCGDSLQRLTTPVLDQQTGLPDTGPPDGRWYLPAGNNRLGQRLAEGLELRLESMVEAIAPDAPGRWRVGDELYDAVVLTAPWPQSRRLLEPWLPPVPPTEPRYVKTLTAFFEYEGDPSGPAAAWAGQEHGPSGHGGLARTLCENHKPGRILDGRTVIVAHATPAFSKEHFEAAREDWSATLEATVRGVWQQSQPPRAVYTHRWGFSTVEEPWPEPPVLPAGLVLAGDALAGSRIGPVYQSGLAAARLVLDHWL